MTIHDKVTDAVKRFMGKTLSTRQVQALVLEKYPGTNPTSVIPSDHSGPNPRSGRSYCHCSGKISQIFTHDNGGYRVLGAGTVLRSISPRGACTQNEGTRKESLAVTTWRTITLENAKYAVKIYNEGLYGCLKNPDLDLRAREMFANGLGSTMEQIAQQVEFIGRDYGGAAGFKAAYSLIPDITCDIVGNREQYKNAAHSALPVRSEIPRRAIVETLYRPFVKPLHGKSNWLVWASKFWHFLNPDAFPIEDSRVDKFFLLSDPNSVDKYLKFLKKFREFALSHEAWVPHLRQVDGRGDGEVSCSENKLWDKVFYGLGELSSGRGVP